MDNNSSELIHILTKAMDDISHAGAHREIDTIITKLLIEFTASDEVEFFLYDATKQQLYQKNDQGLTISMKEPLGLLGNVFLTKKAKRYNHPVSDKYFIREIDNTHSIKLKCQLLIPILDQDELIGMMRLSRNIYHPRQYTRNDLELVKSLQTFVVKVVHILSDRKKTIQKENVDTAKINDKIQQIHAEKEEILSDRAMLLLSTSVHDIRTPASTLYGFLELLEDNVKESRLKEFVTHAKESASFINSLTDTILDQVKTSFNAHEPILETLSSIKYFAQISNMFTATMSDKDISYLVYLDPKIPKEIQIDSHKLKRILINLIGNAYKFTPKDGKIILNIIYHTDSNKLEISVQDSGIGIEESQKTEILKAFQQATETTHQIYGGTGLGLSIANEYIQLLGGTLHINSTVGKGSTFYFSIPITVINAEASQDNFVNLDKKITILCKDRSNNNIDMIHKYLLSLGMPDHHIVVTDTLEKDTTHLFCFEEMFSPDIMSTAIQHKMKVLLFEKVLFSFENAIESQSFSVVAENTYYGDKIHSTVYSAKKKRVLIADDNKINITLLHYMLETDYVEITSALDGQAALELLKQAQEKENRFDVVFLDKHMPIVSGTKVIEEIRNFEKSLNLDPIFAISITGDPNLDEYESTLYNLMVNKPFNKKKVQEAIAMADMLAKAS